MVEVTNAIVVDNSVFWMVAGGLVSIAITVIFFEVSRLFKLVSAVRDVKEEMREIKLALDRLLEFEGEHKRDHETIVKELIENRHEHDRLIDKIERIESK